MAATPTNNAISSKAKPTGSADGLFTFVGSLRKWELESAQIIGYNSIKHNP